jgi:hypothetical protein
MGGDFLFRQMMIRRRLALRRKRKEQTGSETLTNAEHRASAATSPCRDTSAESCDGLNHPELQADTNPSSKGAVACVSVPEKETEHEICKID